MSIFGRDRLVWWARNLFWECAPKEKYNQKYTYIYMPECNISLCWWDSLFATVNGFFTFVFLGSEEFYLRNIAIWPFRKHIQNSVTKNEFCSHIHTRFDSNLSPVCKNIIQVSFYVSSCHSYNIIIIDFYRKLSQSNGNFHGIKEQRKKNVFIRNWNMLKMTSDEGSSNDRRMIAHRFFSPMNVRRWKVFYKIHTRFI